MIRSAVVAALAVAIVVGGTAYASSGDTHFAAGAAFTVNPTTCKLEPPEAPDSAGHTLASLKRFVIREDEIHDRVMSCLKKRHVHYTRVHVTGTTASVTATCPAGTRVTGGGNEAGEAAGSYPSSSRSWTVTKSHDFKPKTLTVWAVCASRA
jgi:hypothetical protein